MYLEPVRLLIVDDSEDDADLLCAELINAGNRLTYHRVESENELRAALKDSEWDMVIADHSMPQFSSLDALNLVKESGRDIPFIIYSGTISDQVASLAMQEGVQDYVCKGDFRRLIPSIERELRSAAVRQAVRRAESHVYRLAYYDELTGLPNHNYFREQVTERIAMRPAQMAGVLFINIDNFMRVNNTFGYATGDALMRQVAARLQACTVEGHALLARLRGDEFAMFSSEIDDGTALEVLVRRVMRAFARPFTHDSLEFELALSIGVCTYPDDGVDAVTLLMNAEAAMALAKRQWGSAYRYYDRETGNLASRRVVLEASLRRAVEHGELFLDYQPIADVQSGSIVGAEALVRWRHPEFGVIPPDQFIPIADESGLIIQVGEWVLREACRQTRYWHDAGFDGLSVSVNVSAVQFAQPQLLMQVKNALRHSGLPAEALQIEITESVLMRDAEATVAVLRDLKEMGIHIAVDDFGTGYSSLSYLKRFPIDALKIDKSFTQDISGDRDASAIISAITALSRSLSLQVVAEGVETHEQRAFLVEQKCDRMQGYLLSKPLPPEQLLEFLSHSALDMVA